MVGKQETGPAAVRFMAFADRPRSPDQGALEISRFSYMSFLSVRGFSDYAGPKQPLANNVAACIPYNMPVTPTLSALR